ncbi:hypothetical protein VitviT2T_005314 [Vitis vinifera]|uniref:Pentatricopeptide repeat-containing protein n=1 Tax=Vitis vinifera TaxID=29760 RepID=A0ABY9BTQ0_VITVI|nr:hypothetical protein VitviT2T_005314 [Vitis vinifera]
MGLEMNVFVVTALIGMYSKCGTVKDVWDVFDRIPIKNVASWNAMIGCYGKHGLVDSSIQLFERMSMKEKYGVEISQEHYSRVLDLLCRSGRMVEAYELFRKCQLKLQIQSLELSSMAVKSMAGEI